MLKYNNKQEKIILKKICQKEEFTLKEIFDDDLKVEIVFESTWKLFRLFRVVCIFTALFVFFQPLFATSSSMYPTIHTKDYMFFKKGNSRIKRGDIVAFVSPYNSSEIYVKRVVGLPEENIKIKDKEVYINSVLLEETYVFIENACYNHKNINSFKIPKNSYYVLGDNRCNSVDSRKFEEVKKDKIKGKLIINIPLGRL